MHISEPINRNIYCPIRGLGALYHLECDKARKKNIIKLDMAR